MTMRRACGLGLAVVLLGFPPSAVGQDKWAQPKCEVKPGHFLVNAGLLYLKSAANGRFQEQIQKDLRDANRSLTQAIISNGQDKNPGAWYYLGRYYVMVKDASGADSAFRRAEALAPTCKDDIYGWRRNELWVPLYNNAVQAYNAGQMDSAIASLQRANTVYDGEPGGFKLLGQLFYNANQPDSAVKYYRLAVTAAADPKYATDKKEAMFNIAASYYRAQRWADAAGAYREYLSIAPNDPQALVGLASVYMSLGKADSANQMFTNIIARADSVDALALFFAGTSIFNALPPAPDTAPAGASCRADARRASRTLTIRAIAVRCDSVTRRAMRDYDATAAVLALVRRTRSAGASSSPR